MVPLLVSEQAMTFHAEVSGIVTDVVNHIRLARPQTEPLADLRVLFLRDDSGDHVTAVLLTEESSIMVSEDWMVSVFQKREETDQFHNSLTLPLGKEKAAEWIRDWLISIA